MSRLDNTSRMQSFRKELAQYVIGLAAAAILTLVPFLAVSGGAARRTSLLIVGILGVIQLGVHVRYFLHVDLSAEYRDQRHLLIFSATLLIIMALGTLWVLLNMNSRMMPGI